jgi:hypothetical protein
LSLRQALGLPRCVVGVEPLTPPYLPAKKCGERGPDSDPVNGAARPARNPPPRLLHR